MRRGYSPTQVLTILAVANLAVAIWIVRLLPQHVLRSLFRFYFDTFHGVTVNGLENYRAAGDRVVIVANHLSFADACLIACYLPDSPTFAVHTRRRGSGGRGRSSPPSTSSRWMCSRPIRSSTWSRRCAITGAS